MMEMLAYIINTLISLGPYTVLTLTLDKVVVLNMKMRTL